MKHIVLRTVSFLFHHGYIQEEDQDVYLYGLDLLLYTVLSYGILLLLGACLGDFSRSFLLLLTFSLLQSNGGGYHANTHLGCFMTMFLFWLLGMAVMAFLPALSLCFLFLLGLPVIFLLAPVEQKNAPIGTEKKRFHKKRAQCIAAALGVSVIFLLFVSPRLGAPISIGIFFSGSSMLAAIRKRASES